MLLLYTVSLLCLWVPHLQLQPAYIKNICLKICQKPEIPWWSSDQDSALPLLGIHVQSVVRELTSQKAHGTAKKIKNFQKGP